ncbi:DNA replication/repair protein RecF [Patescibacteria group bacterium]
MHLISLKLKNFRNYKEAFFNFEKGFNLIIGPNTKGKTNLLEAIYFFIIFRSFRTKNLQNLIKNKEKEFGLEMDFQNQNTKEPKKLEFFLGLITDKLKKNFKINGVVKKQSQRSGEEFQAVLFRPEDLNLIIDSPSSRRSFLDSLLSRLNPGYHQALIEYRKVVQSRSRLLFLVREGRAEPKELNFWDKQFLRLAELIIEERFKLLKEAAPVFKEQYQKISQSEDVFDLDYHLSFKLKNDLKSSLKFSLDELKAEEIEAAQTLLGPHRDDLIFKLNNRNLKDFGSRGEQRSAILALKLAELEVIKKKIEESPIFLLDDVLSELDYDRQFALLESLKDLQSIITTTELDSLKNWLKENQANLIRLK